LQGVYIAPDEFLVVLSIPLRLVWADGKSQMHAALGNELTNVFDLGFPGVGGDVAVEDVSDVSFDRIELEAFGNSVQDRAHASVSPIVGIVIGRDYVSSFSAIFLLEQLLGSAGGLCG